MGPFFSGGVGPAWGGGTVGMYFHNLLFIWSYFFSNARAVGSVLFYNTRLQSGRKNCVIA